jgi:enamine deaminase RidA (YjgF/YER057c/UK114 family)
MTKHHFNLSRRVRSTLLACSTVLLALQGTHAAFAEGIERSGESRILYSTIKVPANAETLYMSGMGASALPDGSWGSMEQQATDIFTKFKTELEKQGWSMSDIVQVRVFGIAGADGVLDFEGFNKGYLAFFGTKENPTKPVRTFVQVADLVREGWLVEVEVQAARVVE